MKTSLDEALVRWSVVCRTWQEFAAGSQPQLNAFLCGWFCREIGMPENTLSILIRFAASVLDFKDSWAAGWKECDITIGIKYEN